MKVAVRRKWRAGAAAPRSVVGFHGCARDVAESILRGQAFIPSSNAADWLGSGIYFWEYAPNRALEWAAIRHAEPAVLEARIQLGDCLNLLDKQHFHGLLRAYDALVQCRTTDGIRIPVNTPRGAHFLDREVIDAYCELTASSEIPFQTVRGCFPEGAAIYAGSKILDKTHVQVAVRDANCIRGLRLL